MTEIKPELVERMVEMTRTIAACPLNVGVGQYQCAIEARAIVAELPAPIDPDLLLAREVAADFAPFGSNIEKLTTAAALAAIKRVNTIHQGA